MENRSCSFIASSIKEFTIKRVYIRTICLVKSDFFFNNLGQHTWGDLVVEAFQSCYPEKRLKYNFPKRVDGADAGEFNHSSNKQSSHTVGKFDISVFKPALNALEGKLRYKHRLPR